MKKLITALIASSAISTAAFAVEPAATPMTLSDSQMEMVTAGSSYQPRASSGTSINNSGNTTNVGVNVSPAANVNLISFGKNSQTANGGNQTQTGNVLFYRR